jgi:hypothetical protein
MKHRTDLSRRCVAQFQVFERPHSWVRVRTPDNTLEHSILNHATIGAEGVEE